MLSAYPNFLLVVRGRSGMYISKRSGARNKPWGRLVVECPSVQSNSQLSV